MDQKENRTHEDQELPVETESIPTDESPLSEQAVPEYQAEEPGSLDLTSDAPKMDLSKPFSWDAVDGVQRSRGTSWYAGLAIITVALMAITIFLMKDWVFAILIPIMATAVFVMTKRPTTTVNYSISPKGVYVGDKLYDFSEFKSFGIVDDPDQLSIVLLPSKRLGLPITLYFEEADGEKIVDMLGARLPMQEIKQDSFDKIIKYLKLQ